MQCKQYIGEKVKFNMFKLLMFLEKVTINFLLFMIINIPKIKKKIINNFWYIIHILLLIIPPVICDHYDWKLPDLYILYAFIMIFLFFLKLIILKEQRNNIFSNYDIDEYYYPVTQIKSNKKIDDVLTIQKHKNGGLTDKEVKERKKDIWKNLSN